MKDKDRIFSAIVVDDEAYRNATYQKVLGNKFNMTFLNNPVEINRKIVMKHDLLIIDVGLCKENRKLTAFSILETYRLTLPTVVVSGQWVDEEGEPSQQILSVPKYKNIIKVISWNDFNKDSDSNTEIGMDIFYAFCEYKNILQVSCGDKFRILHLSDLQFGGSTAGTAHNDNRRIANYLKENELEPDMIVITGDIADKGKEAEYNAAYEWLDTFLKEIWREGGEEDESLRKRVIIVPGNHDYDLSVSASDYYDFQFGAEEKGEFYKKENLHINQKQGFYNFMRFGYHFFHDMDWFLYMDQAIHVNDIFRDWGIRFVLLNSAYQINSDNCEGRFDAFYCDLSCFDDKALIVKEKVYDGLCNILVMHNPPADFGRGSVEGSWGKMQTIIEDNKINMILSGHIHDYQPTSRLSDNGGRYCKNAICISAPTARLDAASRSEDAARGFNIIEFYRENERVKEIIPRYFSIQKASITEIDKENQETFIIK